MASIEDSGVGFQGSVLTLSFCCFKKLIMDSIVVSDWNTTLLFNPEDLHDRRQAFKIFCLGFRGGIATAVGNDVIDSTAIPNRFTLRIGWQYKNK